MSSPATDSVTYLPFPATDAGYFSISDPHLPPHQRFDIITSNDPEVTTSALRRLSARCQHLVIRRPEQNRLSDESGYLVEQIDGHRRFCEAYESIYGHAYEFRRFLNLPEDLTRLWNTPDLPLMPHLALLDLGIMDAVLWIVPILQVLPRASAFKRLIVRGCSDFDSVALPFPFDYIDTRLSRIPGAGILLGWAWSNSTTYIMVFRARLPRLYSAGQIGIIHSWGDNCIVRNDDLLEERDENGRLFTRVFESGKINEESWLYRHSHDPLGPISVVE